MSRARAIVAVLLVVAAVLFGIGTSYEAAERSENDEHTTEPAVRSGAPEHDVAAEASRAVDTDDAGHAGSSERILGIDATSPTVIGLGIALSIAASAAVLLVRRRPVDLAVAAFAGLFGVLDLAEALHGLREDEVTIGLLALVIAALHLGAAVLAFRLEPEQVRASALA